MDIYARLVYRRGRGEEVCSRCKVFIREGVNYAPKSSRSEIWSTRGKLMEHLITLSHFFLLLLLGLPPENKNEGGFLNIPTQLEPNSSLNFSGSTR